MEPGAPGRNVVSSRKRSYIISEYEMWRWGNAHISKYSKCGVRLTTYRSPQHSQ